MLLMPISDQSLDQEIVLKIIMEKFELLRLWRTISIVLALPQQQNLPLQNHPETDLDLWNLTLGYGFHIQRRNPGTFPIESPTSDRGRTMVCAEHCYLMRSPHADGQGRNLPLQLSLQPQILTYKNQK
jgi:hypothetical protein